MHSNFRQGNYGTSHVACNLSPSHSNRARRFPVIFKINQSIENICTAIAIKCFRPISVSNRGGFYYAKNRAIQMRAYQWACREAWTYSNSNGWWCWYQPTVDRYMDHAHVILHVLIFWPEFSFLIFILCFYLIWMVPRWAEAVIIKESEWNLVKSKSRLLK